MRRQQFFRIAKQRHWVLSSLVASVVLLNTLWIIWPSFVRADGPVALNPTSTWFSNDRDMTWDVAWGDVDSDGDLDLAVANDGSPNKVHLNQGAVADGG
jgi:hypothetical protein